MARLSSKANYPGTRRIIEHDLPRIVQDPCKFQAFKKFSQLSSEEARYVLSGSQGPLCIGHDFPRTERIHGEKVFRKHDHSPQKAYIRLNKIVMGQYETMIGYYRQLKNPPRWCGLWSPRATWEHWLETARLYLESTILHELVHWGDDLDGHNQNYEAMHTHRYADHGHHFVREAYGRLIPFQQAGRGQLKNAVKDIPGWFGWDPENKVPYAPTIGNPNPVPEVKIGTTRRYYRSVAG